SGDGGRLNTLSISSISIRPAPVSACEKISTATSRRTVFTSRARFKVGNASGRHDSGRGGSESRSPSATGMRALALPSRASSKITVSMVVLFSSGSSVLEQAVDLVLRLRHAGELRAVQQLLVFASLHGGIGAFAGAAQAGEQRHLLVDIGDGA